MWIQRSYPPTVKQDHGLSKEAIKNYVCVWVKGKLPRLRVERFRGAHKGLCSYNKPHLFVNVYIHPLIWVTPGKLSLTRSPYAAKEERVGFYAAVNVYMVRETTWESGSVGLGIAYFDFRILTGPMGEARRMVNNAFEPLLTDFAAEYYKAGNP